MCDIQDRVAFDLDAANFRVGCDGDDQVILAVRDAHLDFDFAEQSKLEHSGTNIFGFDVLDQVARFDIQGDFDAPFEHVIVRAFDQDVLERAGHAGLLGHGGLDEHGGEQDAREDQHKQGEGSDGFEHEASRGFDWGK